MALFNGQNIKCKYSNGAFLRAINCQLLYTRCISMSCSECCVHQYYVEVNGISKAYTSVLYAVNRVLNVANLLYIFLAVWHQDQT